MDPLGYDIRACNKEALGLSATAQSPRPGRPLLPGLYGQDLFEPHREPHPEGQVVQQGLLSWLFLIFIKVSLGTVGGMEAVIETASPVQRAHPCALNTVYEYVCPSIHMTIQSAAICLSICLCVHLSLSLSCTIIVLIIIIYTYIYMWYPLRNLLSHTSMIDKERKVLLGFGGD